MGKLSYEKEKRDKYYGRTSLLMNNLGPENVYEINKNTNWKNCDDYNVFNFGDIEVLDK